MYNSWLRTQDRQDCKLNSLVNPSQLCRWAELLRRISAWFLWQAGMPSAKIWVLVAIRPALSLPDPLWSSLTDCLSNPCELRQWVSWEAFQNAGGAGCPPWALLFPTAETTSQERPSWCGAVLSGEGAMWSECSCPSYLSTVVLNLCGPGDATN